MSSAVLVGVGFGAGDLMLGYLLSAPAFLLNIISPLWGAVGAFGIIVLDYIPRAILNWPEINPLVVLNSKADGLLFLNLVLSVASTVAWEVMMRRGRKVEDHTPE